MAKSNLCFLLLFSLLLLLTPSLSKTSHHHHEEEDDMPEAQLFQCLLSCSQPRRNEHELTPCEQRCVDEYQEIKTREREEGGGHGGRDEWSHVQTEDPRKVHESCQRGCDKLRGSSSSQEQCRRTCRDLYGEVTKHRRRQDRRRGEDCGCGGGYDCHCRSEENHHEPEQRYKECRTRCERVGGGQQKQLCLHRCQSQFEKQKREHGGDHGREHGVAYESKEYEEEEEIESRNPYLFEKQRFNTKFRTEQGHIKQLPRFSKKSPLLRGIENYRLVVLEANPNTFVLPHHSDAESLFFVVGGEGTISFVWEKQRRSYSLKKGDVMRVPAGSIVYLINRNDNEKLHVLKLLQPVNTPGKFKDYFAVGGENPESFYRTFSNEILEAAFNTPRENLERLFGQQTEGAIISATKEQIRALSKESESSSKGRHERWSPINVVKKNPLFSNDFGQYFEASPEDHDQLKDLDIAVGFMTIKKGGMIAPYYNSKSTKLALVVGGSGYFEMACPHLSGQSQSSGRSESQYVKVRGRLSVGDVFVVPAGHPVVMVATGGSELQLASFGISGSFNQKHFLAGKENIWKEVETEAKTLSFGIPAEEVEEIFGKQDESYFVAGPEGKRHRIASILEFAGF